MQSYGNPTYSHAWGSSVSFSGKAHVKTSE
jgi:hypothetical protein